MRSLSAREQLALGAIAAFGLLLRAGVQWGRLFTGDEIGTLINLQKSAGYLLTHFGGWLTLLPLAASIAVIPLTASLAFARRALPRAESSRPSHSATNLKENPRICRSQTSFWHFFPEKSEKINKELFRGNRLQLPSRLHLWLTIESIRLGQNSRFFRNACEPIYSFPVCLKVNPSDN